MNTDSILIGQFIQEQSNLAASVLEDIESEKLAAFFSDSPKEWLMKVLPHMNAQGMSEVFERMDPERLVSLLESMELAHSIASIRMMKKELAEVLLNRLSEEKSTLVKRLLRYLDHTVGASMDTLVFTLPDNLTVKEAMAALKKRKDQIPPELFVLDASRKLVGVISLSELITGKSAYEIKAIMKTRLITLSPEIPIQSLINHPQWLEFYALPVVDPASVFLGAIRLETIRSILFQPGTKGEETGQLAINALGELYRLGLAGLLRSAVELDVRSGK